MPRGRPRKNAIVDGLATERPDNTSPEAMLIEEWVDEGIACDYVQFSTKPVPTTKGNEPVWEIKLDTPDKRYKVDAIYYTPHGVIFNAYGLMKCVPLGNVAHVQFI